MLKSKKLLPLFILIIATCGAGNSFGQTKAEDVVDTNLCEILKNPLAFNRRLIEITAFPGQAFENFSLFDPSCEKSRNGVWLEYGGKVQSGVVYCCGNAPTRRRSRNVRVDGMITQLVEDANFKEFDKLISQPPGYTIRATLKGRFFAGKAFDTSGGKIFGGYGHLGCCSLLVIEQVIDFDRTVRAGLDYGNYKQLNLFNTYDSYRFLESAEPILSLQKSVENEGPSWRFDDPRRTALESLARVLKVGQNTFTDIRVLQDDPGRKTYYVKTGNDKEYVIVVSRPYFLSFYAKDPQKVIWTTAAAYELGDRKTP